MTRHPTERELAWEAEDQGSHSVQVHLRWCSSCRRTAAEYGWLQDELGRALRAEAERVPLPVSDWEGVRRRLRGAPQRQTVKRRAAAVGLAVMVCVTLLVPLVNGGGNRAWAISSESGDMSTAPAPVVVVGGGNGGTPPSRAVWAQVHARRVSLPFVPPPTPPEPQV